MYAYVFGTNVKTQGLSHIRICYIPENKYIVMLKNTRLNHQTGVFLSVRVLCDDCFISQVNKQFCNLWSQDDDLCAYN